MLRKQWIMILLITGLLCVLSANGSGETEELILFNAASTTDVMADLAELYQESTGILIHLNPASSGTLARQIEQGAPADLYLSANLKWMDHVQALNNSFESSTLLGNRLVWISGNDTETTIDFRSPNAPEIENYLSMGDPEHVPAGKYAAEALKSLGWFKQVEDRILPGSDVRAALSVVELQEAQWGIVYETDAMKSTKVFVNGIFPEETHTPILYALALLSSDNENARDFYQFLQSPEALAIYRSYGFTPREKE